MKPPRVLVNGWFWGQMHTGSGQYLHHLARCLPQVAGQLQYILALPQASAAPAPAGWQVVVAPPAAGRLGENLAKLWFEQISYPAACRRLAADIAFVPYWGSPWRLPCATAVTVHDLIPLLLPAYRGGPLQRAYSWLVSQTAGRAALILTDSQASRQDIIQRLSLPPDRVQAVLLAADERFRPATDQAELARVQVRYSLPERFMLYLGGFDVRKNVAGLVRAYARWVRQDLPLLRRSGRSDSVPPLVIAGKLPAADTPFTPDPRRMAAEAGVADRVHFTGWVEEDDKPALYSLASLFIFPSLVEGFGLPVAEAAACGTPVVTSNRSSLPEAAPGAILVDPEDEAALAAAMAQALQAARPAAHPEARRTWLDVAHETAAWLKELS